jgi:hypothetical protein
MSGINNNRLNIVMTSEELASVKSLFTAIQEKLHFLIGLTPAERISLPKINVNNKVFAEDACNVLKNNPQLFPPFMTITELENDLELFRQLDELHTLSRQLTERIVDTRMLAGSEAYTTALSIYRMSEAAALSGLAGSKIIYKQLRDRFKLSRSTDSGNAPNPEVGSPTS